MVVGLGERGMANSPALALVLRECDYAQLVAWTRSTSIRAGIAQRAKITLLASEGVVNARISTEMGTTTTSVWKWRNPYVEAELGGLADAPSSGRPKNIWITQIWLRQH